jgi:uncharacterized protein (DUF433 family)
MAWSIAPARSTTRASRRSLAGYCLGVAFTRITVDTERMGGVPCVRGLRFPVATVVAMVADGMTTEEILDEHPDLEAADVAECLRFAAPAVQERELPLRQPA